MIFDYILFGFDHSRTLHLWTNVTSIPHIDGHQWRKYGQKKISGEIFLRSFPTLCYMIWFVAQLLFEYIILDSRD